MDANHEGVPDARLARMQGDVAALKDELKAFTRKFALEVVRIHARFDKQADLIRGERRAISSKVTKQFDAFMSETGKIDRAQIIADWRVSQLEKRIDKIESRPS